MNSRKVLTAVSMFNHSAHFHAAYLHAFQESGWIVHVAGGGDTPALRSADRMISLPFEKRYLSMKNLKAAGLLHRLMAEEQYDLVITHTTLAAFFTRLAVRGLAVKPRVIVMMHGYLFDDDSSRLLRGMLLLAERYTARDTDLLLTMNQWDYALAKQYRLGREIRNIPGLGVDYTQFGELTQTGRAQMRQRLGLSPDSFVLFFAAEFTTRKSQQVLIRMMKELPERAVLVLAGSGIRKEDCMELTKAEGLDSRVLFPGYVDPTWPWYSMADVAVSSSRLEGMPFNVMEAMHMGLPIVASRVKGNTDLITDEKNGLLVPYGDSHAFAQAVRRLIDSPELCRRLGAQARADSEKYAIERILPGVMELYLADTEKRQL